GAGQTFPHAFGGAASEVLELPDPLPERRAPRLLDAVEDLVDLVLRVLRRKEEARPDQGGDEGDGGRGGDSRHGVLLKCLRERASPIIIDVAGDGSVLNESRMVP